MASEIHPALLLPLKFLSWLGRQGTRAVAIVVFIGITLPWIGRILQPYLTEAVFVLLTIAFLRVDVAEFRNCCRRSLMLLTSIVWTSVAIPIILGLAYLALGFPEKFPELFPGCMLQAIASPIMAASAFASLIGLNASLVLFTLVISTALLPITAPIFTLFFMGSTFTISPYILAAKLSLIIAGAALSGSLLRRFAGLSKVQKYNYEIDGFNVIILFVFAAIIMKDVGASIISQPGTVLILAILATAVFIILLISTVVVFLPSGIENALALGLMASQRNMGLMLAVTGGALPDLAWLFFALSQFPIYIGPHLLKPTIHKLLRITQ